MLSLTELQPLQKKSAQTLSCWKKLLSTHTLSDTLMAGIARLTDDGKKNS